MNSLTLPLDRPIAFHIPLAKALGGINAALFLQQIYFWSDKGGRDDGWIYKSFEDMEAETTLTKRQQSYCREHLVELGVIEHKVMKVNGLATNHYRINIKTTQKVIDDYFSGSNKKSLLRSNKMSLPSNTEITSEITSQKADISKTQKQSNKRKNITINKGYSLVVEEFKRRKGFEPRDTGKVRNGQARNIMKKLQELDEPWTVSLQKFMDWASKQSDFKLVKRLSGLYGWIDEWKNGTRPIVSDKIIDDIKVAIDLEKKVFKEKGLGEEHKKFLEERIDKIIEYSSLMYGVSKEDCYARLQNNGS